MKNLTYLSRSRKDYFGRRGDEYNGAFHIKIDGKSYDIIASNGGGWDHISVSNNKHVPSWRVMCKIKDMFFENDEAAMQLHPAKRDYINVHPNCLHLWRPLSEKIPLPPKEFI